MKSVKIYLPEDLKQVEIHTFADLHIGDAECDIKEIKNRIQKVAETENAYAILNGDLMNNAIKTSISDTYSETLTPMGEIKELIELFTPIKDKILGVTSGNHERRSYNGAGVDLNEIIAMNLGVQDRYAAEGILIFLRFGKNARGRRQYYSIYATHGSGGGRRAGSKANKLEDMASIIDADIYVHSHTHLPVIMKNSFFRVDNKNSTTSLVDKLFVNTSSELNYGGYGQIGEYTPSSKQCPVIYLDGSKRDFKAIL